MAVATLRYVPALGGIAALHIPLATGALCVGGVALGVLEIAVAVALFGFVAQTVARGVVVEISPLGLTRGFLLKGRFLGRTTVMPWPSIVSVHTDFRRHGDDTALATIVRDRDGRSIHFTTAMGLGAYWSCVAAVAAHAVAAQRTGLTEAVLADEPPDRRSVVAAAATAGALGLVMVALVGIHYLWAQGRSSLARQLEQSTTTPEPAAPSSLPFRD
jgi:hypothetical protein